MRKAVILSGLFLGILALLGCGGSSNDPLGTGTITLTADSTTVAAGGSITITAKVTNKTAAGTDVPVLGERVAFALLTNNGGSLQVPRNETGADGIVRAVFTAGSGTLLPDTIRATTSNGATATITITKTGGIVGPRLSSLTAGSSTLTAGQTTTITAVVHDQNGNVVANELVTFTLVLDNSGGRFRTDAHTWAGTIQVRTDQSGQAIAVYMAGDKDPSVTVQDTIKAYLASGSDRIVLITRSVQAVGNAVTLAATPNTGLLGGQTSILTATVKNAQGVSISNEVVTFSITVNASGGRLLSDSARTDGTGVATVIYQAGSNSPTLAVQDTVQATLSSGAVGVATISRNAGAAAYVVTVEADPSTLGSTTGQSVITATVKNNAGTAVSNVLVDFAVVGGPSVGSMLPVQATTDASGNAVSTFTSAAGTARTTVVTATVHGTSYSGAVPITVP